MMKYAPLPDVSATTQESAEEDMWYNITNSIQYGLALSLFGDADYQAGDYFIIYI